MIRKWIFSLHRFLGALLSLLFLMWFITGIVLIYHKFPSISHTETYKNMETIPYPDKPILDTLIEQQTDKPTIENITIYHQLGKTYASVKTQGSTYTINLNNGKQKKGLTLTEIKQIANHWNTSTISNIEILNDLEQWIMYTRYKKEFPIYKIHFEDQAQHQLYLSSRTGEALQYTSNNQRFWAWMGAIPHMIYFSPIRKHTQAWINTIIIIGSIGLFMCLTGMYVGINAIIRRHKIKGKWETPYQKKIFRWHHLSGILFGIFAITWAYSGIMSLTKVPQWIAKTHQKYNTSTLALDKISDLSQFKLDYKKIIDQYPLTKEIKWINFYNTPIYETIIDNQKIYFDASSNQLKKLFLEKQTVYDAIQIIHGQDIKININLISEYDNYYLPRKEYLPLPVYKVILTDKDNSTYYINPKTGQYKYLNNNKKVRKWMYNALHLFQTKWMHNHPLVRELLLWTLSLCGILISSTGVGMSIGFFKRKIKRKK